MVASLNCSQQKSILSVVSLLEFFWYRYEPSGMWYIKVSGILLYLTLISLWYTFPLNEN